MGTCTYCFSQRLKIFSNGSFHPANGQHGPYDLYLCEDCGSLITYPLPDAQDLQKLYAGFEGGMIPEIRLLRNSFPLKQWFDQCLSHALSLGQVQQENISSWIDLGAGNGEMVMELSQKFPGVPGLGVDFHAKPSQISLPSNIQWQSHDLNNPFFAEKILPEAELIFAITVIEHLLYPDSFIKQSLTLLKKPGIFYFTTPRTDCLAFRLLGKRWPYFLPGEHIHIPSVKGMRILLQRICSEIFERQGFSITVQPVILPYPVGYYLGYAGLHRLAKFIRGGSSIRIPTGLLEAAVVLHP